VATTFAGASRAKRQRVVSLSTGDRCDGEKNRNHSRNSATNFNASSQVSSRHGKPGAIRSILTAFLHETREPFSLYESVHDGSVTVSVGLAWAFGKYVWEPAGGLLKLAEIG
jgi:hypothetical protein